MIPKSTLLLIVIMALFQNPILAVMDNMQFKWVFIYYMSYDNNLDRLGEGIIEELKVGVICEDVAVVIQADFNDLKGMQRILITYSNGEPTIIRDTLNNENSSDVRELEAFLNWVSDNLKSQNYVLTFLDHGGKLNQMCLDENPYMNSKDNRDKAPKGLWLDAMETGKICRVFNQNVNGKVSLLFLQQCGRGSIENLYNFIDSAPYIMSSPMNVGAPNTYYKELLETICNNPDLNGIQIADSIMYYDEHYQLYTLVDNKELKKFPRQINRVIDCLDLSRTTGNTGYTVFHFEDETNYDFLTLIDSLEGITNQKGRSKLLLFSNWVEDKLIVKKQSRNKSDSSLSGLSIFIPSTDDQKNRYSFLPVYNETKLGKLFSN